jgi:flagellar protein FlaG
MTPTIPSVSPTVAPQGSGHSAVSEDSRFRAPGSTAALPAKARAAAEPDMSLEAALPWLREAAEKASVDLTFRIDMDLQRVIVVVANRRDGTVVRQIPSEEALRIAKHLKKNGPSAGGLLDGIA